AWSEVETTTLNPAGKDDAEALQEIQTPHQCVTIKEEACVMTRYQPLGLQPPQTHLHNHPRPGSLSNQPPRQPLTITTHHYHQPPPPPASPQPSLPVTTTSALAPAITPPVTATLALALAISDTSSTAAATSALVLATSGASPWPMLRPPSHITITHHR
ncbi:hypothetical protein C0993_011059, partial [Termitomyces sp. T159_Od127]